MKIKFLDLANIIHINYFALNHYKILDKYTESKTSEYYQGDVVAIVGGYNLIVQYKGYYHEQR